MSELKNFKRKSVKNEELRVILLRKIFAKRYREHREQVQLRHQQLVEKLKMESLRIQERQNRDTNQMEKKERFRQQMKTFFGMGCDQKKSSKGIHQPIKNSSQDSRKR